MNSISRQMGVVLVSSLFGTMYRNGAATSSMAETVAATRSGMFAWRDIVTRHISTILALSAMLFTPHQRRNVARICRLSKKCRLMLTKLALAKSPDRGHFGSAAQAAAQSPATS